MSLPPGKIRQAAHVLLIVLFAGAITAPLLSNLTGLTPAPTLQENRRLAPLPAFRWSRGVILGYPTAFEAYFNDHFPFRDRLVWSYNLAKARWLRVSPQPDVVIGREGWLYYREGLLDHNAPITPFTEAELDHWTRVLEERRQWLAARNCRFLVVIAPDKQSIYPEYLPGWARPVAGGSRLDQLLQYARTHSDVPIVDLREPLLRAKAQERVYCKTDTHWNERGGFAGYESVAAALARWFPQVRPLPRSALAPCVTASNGGDLALMLGLPRDYREEQLYFTPRASFVAHAAPFVAVPPTPADAPDIRKPAASECGNDALPRAIMFRDSFATALQPFLSEHFRRIVYFWQDAFDAAAVERERPDVVLYEFVERRLTGPLPDSGLPAPESGPP